MDPQSWGLGRRRAHEYVVKEASTRRQVLDRKAAGDENAAAPMRPPIWADSIDDQRSGVRVIEARWVSRAPLLRCLVGRHWESQIHLLCGLDKPVA